MTNTVYLQREFACEVEELYQWLTQPQLIAQWFGPEQLTVTNVTNSIVKGGAYSIELLKPSGQTFYIEGRYLDLEKPSLIEFSLHYRDASSLPPDSVVTIQLGSTSPGKSSLKLKQVFELEPADMASRTRGWEHMLGVLESLVAGH